MVGGSGWGDAGVERLLREGEVAGSAGPGSRWTEGMEDDSRVRNTSSSRQGKR